MRCCSWFLMGWMLFKLSLGSAMAMPIPIPIPIPIVLQSHWQTPAATAHQNGSPTEQTSESPFAINTLALLASPDCHGHSDSQADKSSSDTTSTSEDTHTRCTSPDDCHHCCAVGLGQWADKAQHTAPSGQPQLAPQGWQSANFGPLFRPPIA